MAVTRSGKLVGSVSGGCVEGAVFEEAQRVLRSRKPKLVKYGISKESAWDIGLACGGGIEVYIAPLE
jgi:xanthine/CO dehydrogenase XdhC/CoxF family maturation factor